MEWLLAFLVVAVIGVCGGIYGLSLYLINRSYEKTQEIQRQWVQQSWKNTCDIWAKFIESQEAFGKREKLIGEWVQYLMAELSRMSSAQGEEAVIRVERLFQQMEVHLATSFADAMARARKIFEEEMEREDEEP